MRRSVLGHPGHENEASDFWRAFQASSGASSAEFALILPLLLLLLFGVVQYGLMFFTYNNMNNAAREGARAFAVGDVNELGAETLSRNFLVGWARPHAVVDADTITQSGVVFARVRITMPGQKAGIVGFAPGPSQLAAHVLIREE